MKRILLIILLLGFIIYSNAQIAGLSASKTSTLSATVVDKNSIEFEPSLLFLKNQTNFSNSFNWRFSYGLFNNFEFGMSVPSNLDALGIGAKYLVVNTYFLKLSAIAGTNFNFLETKVFDNAGLGLVTTLNYTEDFSSDFDLHLSSDFN